MLKFDFYSFYLQYFPDYKYLLIWRRYVLLFDSKVSCVKGKSHARWLDHAAAMRYTAECAVRTWGVAGKAGSPGIWSQFSFTFVKSLHSLHFVLSHHAGSALEPVNYRVKLFSVRSKRKLSSFKLQVLNICHSKVTETLWSRRSNFGFPRVYFHKNFQKLFKIITQMFMVKTD